MECWKSIPDYDNYECSTLGRIRNKRNGYVLSTIIDKRSGRHYIHLGRDFYGQVAPLCLATYKGPRPNGMMACHNNGNVDDNSIDNLRWDTQSNNILDCVTHGTHFNASKDACKLGHKLIKENLRVGMLKKGKRSCLSCHRASSYCKLHPELDYKETADKYFERILSGVK